MEARIPPEVRRNRSGRDFLATGELRDRVGVEAEAAEVVGEVEDAAGRQAGDCGAQQAHVAGLDVEVARALGVGRSEEHTSALQSLMRISYAVLCVHKKKEGTRR